MCSIYYDFLLFLFFLMVFSWILCPIFLMVTLLYFLKCQGLNLWLHACQSNTLPVSCIHKIYSCIFSIMFNLFSTIHVYIHTSLVPNIRILALVYFFHSHLSSSLPIGSHRVRWLLVINYFSLCINITRLILCFVLLTICFLFLIFF